MSTALLRDVLSATGYLLDDAPAPGVVLGHDTRPHRANRTFVPDAVWQGNSALAVYFKCVDVAPAPDRISAWHREVWNEGFAPLLWVISPEKIDLYNGFGRPTSPVDGPRHRLHTFERIEQELHALDQLAGRLAMETGQFWVQEQHINRKTRVDAQLLADLASLERDLVRSLPRPAAQALIGRTIFTQYLIDRQIIGTERLANESGAPKLANVLRAMPAAQRLFNWLASTFNGDMFSDAPGVQPLDAQALARMADFLDAVDPTTGQLTFFPYRFDVIPVELISSIYEQFAHSTTGDRTREKRGDSESSTAHEAKTRGVHYTRLPVVSLILDEVMHDATGNETLLDLTCGSGVFLVEGFRRLVARKGNGAPTRRMIRDTLYNQVYGVDISESAIRIAAFSLYLAALELDPDPQPPESLRFERLIGRTLLVGDAHDIDTTPNGAALLSQDGSRRRFDIIVGNPPWTFRGKAGTKERRRKGPATAPRQPRGEGLDFANRAIEFGHDATRYGVVLSAMPFVAGSQTGYAAAHHLVTRLAPVTLVNLTAHRWLFPTATMPAIVLLARHRAHASEQVVVVNVPWSPASEKTHTFDVSPSDVTSFRLEEWTASPDRLKVAFMGRSRDVMLLRDLRERFATVTDWLGRHQTAFRDGLIYGEPSTRRDASFLKGMPVLTNGDALQPFVVPPALHKFGEWPKEKLLRAQWPRQLATYRAPLLLVKEVFQATPRPIAAVAGHDMVYTDAFFGASLPAGEAQNARLVAAILGSALASWFFLLTASEFGVWKPRLLTRDVGHLPIPDLARAQRTRAGRRLLQVVDAIREAEASTEAWTALDEAVFDLYELDADARIVVRDGFRRAARIWEIERVAAVAPASSHGHLCEYAEVFVRAIDAWLHAAGEHHVRAEIFDMREGAALRVVRFVMAVGRQEPSVAIVPAEGDLRAVLERLSTRLQVPIGSHLTGSRTLHVHAANEVVVIKPAAARHWTGAMALEDADAVVAQSFNGAMA